MRRTDEHEAPNSRGLSTRKVWGHATCNEHDASNSQRLSIGKVWGHAEVVSGRVFCSTEHHEEALVEMHYSLKGNPNATCGWVSSCNYSRSSGEHKS